MTPKADGKATNCRGTFRMEVAVGIAVRASPATIWALLTDAEDFPRWNSTIRSVQGTIAAGQTIAPERTFRLRVTTFVPNSLMVWQDGSPLFRGVRRYTLTPGSNGTTDVAIAEVFSGVLLPLIARSLPDQGSPFERYAADLKAEVERGT